MVARMSVAALRIHPRLRGLLLAACLPATLSTGGCGLLGKRGDEGSGEAGSSATVDRSQQRVRVFISGVQGEMREAASGALEIKGLMHRQDASDALIRRVHERAAGQMSKALQPFGHYHAEIGSTLELEDGTWFARYRVRPGEPTRIAESTVAVEGPGGGEASVVRAVAEFQPAVGGVLDHRVYQASKARLADTLAEQGYFDAEALSQRVEVSLAARRAEVDLRYASGDRYRFGETRFEGAQLPDALLRGYLPYAEGDPYHQDRLLELQQRLLDSDYFGEVEIETEQDGEARQAPVRIRLNPAKRTVYSGGLAFGTDSGIGVLGSMNRRWLNERGHKLALGAEISQRLTSIGGQYRIPLPGAAREAWTLALGYRDEETDSATQQLTTLSLLRLRETAVGSFGYGIGAQSGDFEVGGISGNSTLLYPELRWSLRRTDDPLSPSEGWSLASEARIAPGGLGSDAAFALLRAEARLLRPLANRHRLLARLQLGALWTDDFDRLPPAQRFFAGGDRSIRGFAFQELGPKNELGRVAGGRYLAVASLEYERHLFGDFGVAGFVDAGNAFDAGKFDAAVGIGLGLRWRSPVGLVRVDLAYPAAGDGDRLRLHLQIGPEL